MLASVATGALINYDKAQKENGQNVSRETETTA